MQSLVVMQIVGVRIAQATMQYMVEQMECTKAEAEWFSHTITTSLDATIVGMILTAKRQGFQMPDEVVPRDYLPYEEVLKVVTNMIASKEAQQAQAVESAKENYELSKKAFGESAVIDRQAELSRMFQEVKIEAKDVADALFDRHLKLVH